MTSSIFMDAPVSFDAAEVAADGVLGRWALGVARAGLLPGDSLVVAPLSCPAPCPPHAVASRTTSAATAARVTRRVAADRLMAIVRE
jgi:hypothetical protein